MELPYGAFILLSFSFQPKYRLYEAALTWQSTTLFGDNAIQSGPAVEAKGQIQKKKKIK